MHKATFLEGTLCLTIHPDGPILIKAGETGGADPTLPDMEFIRTKRSAGEMQDAQEPHTSKGHIYIPGSSLKGVIRAQCERICRSLDHSEHNPDADNPPLADNPVGKGKQYRGVDDIDFSCGEYFNTINESLKSKTDRTAIIYRRSSFVSQMFGHTSLAGRVRFADAYATRPLTIEERNGVAIDRIYGSVAFGPFNYETVVAGSFATRIDFKNITLAQLALLGLSLRDLADGRIGMGFGKSRGLGRVKVTLDSLEVYYPTCTHTEEQGLQLLNGNPVAPPNYLAGLGALCQNSGYQQYNLPAAEDDRVALPAGVQYTRDEFIGVRLRVESDKVESDKVESDEKVRRDEKVRAVWRACMSPWKKAVGINNE